MEFLIRKAKMDDVRSIYQILNYYADRRELLPRALSEIYENLQQFFVVTHGRTVVGCVALYVTWEDLAEVKALAVAEGYRGKGLGMRLLKTVIQEAKKLGVKTLFTLTIREKLFRIAGFSRTKKSQLPHKVWTECVRCPYFPEACIETSMTLQLGQHGKKMKKTSFAEAFMSTSEPMVPAEPKQALNWPPPYPGYSKKA